jgi:8-oxo-dGTP diphosphatase
VFQLRIDPAPDRTDAVDLIEPAGEYMSALASLTAQAASRHVPDQAFLELYTYELLERLRERARAGADGPGGAGVVVRVPLWPEAMFTAAGIGAHAGRELLAQLPAVDGTTLVVRSLAHVVDAARRVLGELRFDLDGYRRELLAIAAARAWTILGDEPAVRFRHEPPRLQAGGAPDRTTASALLLRDGRVLLERRPVDARVDPDRWDTPGGHLEAGESPEQALVRELREELGIELQQFRLVGAHDVRVGREHYRHFVYLADAFGGDPAPRCGQQLGWFEVAECLLLEGLAPLTGRVLLDCLERGWIRASG